MVEFNSFHQKQNLELHIQVYEVHQSDELNPNSISVHIEKSTSNSSCDKKVKGALANFSQKALLCEQ